MFYSVASHEEGSVASHRAIIGIIHLHIVKKRTGMLVVLLSNGVQVIS